MSSLRFNTRSCSSGPARLTRETIPGWGAVVREGDAYDLIQTLPPASVDLLITSPPYWGHRTYEQAYNWNLHKELPFDSSRVPPYDLYRRKGGVLGLEPFPEWYVQHLVEILEHSKSCLKAHG